MPNTDLLNPEATTGHNEAPDYAQQVTERMQEDYRELNKSVTDILTEARALPVEVNDTETMGIVARVIKRMRDLASRIEAVRVKEKEPHLRAGNAVDQFFGAMANKLMRAKKTDVAGAVDVLTKRVDDFNQRMLAEERRKREEAERIAREAQRRAEQERLENARRAQEAFEAAERARKAENIAAHQAQAQQFAAQAEQAKVEAEIAEEKVTDARIESAAKPADMVRTRHDDGVMTTMKQEPFVEITDSMQLNATTLWPFVKDEHKLAALKAWAKITQHKTPMAGAIIEMRNKTVVL